MPNHIHVLWEMTAMNGKEKPNASFNKKTAHLFVLDLKANHQQVLNFFKVREKEREHRIWQRDPLAVLMDNRSKIEQKLDYIHNNPLQERWNLAIKPEDYYWSSAGFYEKDDPTFSFLTHYKDKF